MRLNLPLGGPLRPPALTPEGLARAYAEIATSLVALHFNVPAGEIFGPARGKAEITFARQVAMYLTHVAFGLSLARVGPAFGRDRTTASHACHVIEDARDEPGIDAEIGRLEAALRELPKMRPRAMPVAGTHCPHCRAHGGKA